MSQVYCESCGWKGEAEDLLKDEDGFELCPECQSQEIFDVDSLQSEEDEEEKDWEDEENEDWEDEEDEDWEDEEDEDEDW